jgi:hypothetical protein
MQTDVHIAGELASWPSKSGLARILRAAGLQVTVARYSIRVESCDDFKFQEYGGDLGAPEIDAGADSLEKMLRDGGIVSRALADAGIRHRFEIYNDDNELVGYLHHDWPQTPVA